MQPSAPVFHAAHPSLERSEGWGTSQSVVRGTIPQGLKPSSLLGG